MEEFSMNPNELLIKSLFKPAYTAAWEYLSRYTYPWEALAKISDFIQELGTALDKSEYEHRSGDVWIHKTADVAPSAYIGDIVIIGAGTQVRHCAYIRGSVLVGCEAVVGNSTELKNAILFDGVQVPHYNYIGDSILGYKSHMGAGAITSNVKSDRTPISVKCGNERIDTGLKKFGAILGDHVEVGCNSVLNPGTIIGGNSSIYPLSSVRGFVPPNSIYKHQSEIAMKYNK